MRLSRRAVLTGVVTTAAARAEAPILIGVSGPLTGQYAQYGADWRLGFDLALDEINVAPIAGRPLAYVFEDTQSDPRQAVTVAQKFAADPRIIAEIGDFSSAASMAASPIYQRNGLVQFGFTNSHPDFTKGGDSMWSTAPNQNEDMPTMAAYAVTSLGMRRIAILHINSDWGRTSLDLFSKAVTSLGATVTDTEAYLPSERDFRSSLVRVRDSQPDGVALISYYPDGALIARQIRAQGLHQLVVAASSVYSPKFLELGGDAVDGIFTSTPFFPDDPRPVARRFVAAFAAKYHAAPDYYAARSYDAMTVLAAALRAAGPDRAALRAALATIEVPSVIYGTIRFDPQTRRVAKPANTNLVVHNGAFVVWDGTRPVVAN